jgi:hypothetical protein
VKDGSLLSNTMALVNIPRAGVGTAEDHLVTELGNVTAIVNTDPRLTDPERTSGYAQGLLEWYAFLYPGYKNAINREELFQGFMQDLPPRRLAQIISTELGFTGIPAGGTDQDYVARVLTRFRNRSRGALTRPRPTQAEMIRITRAMTTQIREAGAAV